jgi:peroxiredoxin
VYSATASTATLVRNLVLAAVAAFVVVEGPAPSISSWVQARSAAELVAIGLSIAALVFLAIVLWLRAQNRSLRRFLSESPAQGPFIEGLPPGTFAPNFTLPDEHGHAQTLDSLLARGLPVVLMFFDQTCGPCEQVATHAARWQAMMSDRLTIAIISAGSHEQSGSTWAEYRLENVLYDEPIAVRDQFRLRSTPTALIIDPTGIIGTTPVGGEHAIEVLVRLALERTRSDGHRDGPMPMAELGGRTANA